MKNLAAAPTVAVIILAHGLYCVNSFSPAKNARKASLLSLQVATRSSSVDQEDAVVQTSEESILATEAVERLLESQKKDVAETQALLDQIRATHTSERTDKNGKTYGLAESILSGFDYGFQSRSEGVPLKQQHIVASSSPEVRYGPPTNVVDLTMKQFFRNLNAIRGEYTDEVETVLTKEQETYRALLETLTFDCKAVWAREQAGGELDAPLLIKVPYLVLCWVLDNMFENEYVPSRFFYLETVARMPYFAYITMLHLYETLGFWRRNTDLKRIHMAQEINEYHHLMIMESLGGDQKWWVRALAQHSAIAYYIALCMLWLISPTLNYKFSELLEGHAVHSYGQLLEENEETLRALPPSLAAAQYYSLGASDPFLAEYQTNAIANGREIRRPGFNMTTLYDVFAAIKADEGDHVGTMEACIDPSVPVKSVSVEKRILAAAAIVAVASTFASGMDLDADSVAGIVSQLGGDVADEDLSEVAEASAPAVQLFFAQILELLERLV